MCRIIILIVLHCWVFCYFRHHRLREWKLSVASPNSKSVLLSTGIVSLLIKLITWYIYKCVMWMVINELILTCNYLTVILMCCTVYSIELMYIVLMKLLICGAVSTGVQSFGIICHRLHCAPVSAPVCREGCLRSALCQKYSDNFSAFTARCTKWKGLHLLPLNVHWVCFLAFRTGAVICCSLDQDLSGLTAKKNAVDPEEMSPRPQFELPIA